MQGVWRKKIGRNFGLKKRKKCFLENKNAEKKFKKMAECLLDCFENLIFI
jgi:hypothetical protein